MSDFTSGWNTAFAVMGAGLIVIGGGVVGGIGYGANKLYFEPNARKVEFNARAQNVMSSRNLRTISVSDFKEGAAGCSAPLYGANFAAENRQGQAVRGTLCVSRSTEMSFRLKR